MVTKQAKLRASKTKNAEKTVKIHKHHAKPYRKRHIGSLVIFLVALVILVAILVQYRDQLISGLASSRSFVAGLFNQNEDYDVAVTSSYGYSLSFDQKEFYASAIDAETGDLYLGSELNERRAYNIVRVAPHWTTDQSSGSSAMTLTFHPGPLGETDTLASTALADGGIQEGDLQQVARSVVTLGGQEFEKITWESRHENALGKALKASFVTYGAIVKGNVVTIAISLGLEGGQADIYQPVLDSLSFNEKVGAVSKPSAAAVAQTVASRSLLDVLTNTGLASAATASSSPSSEKVAALYSPAVVKVYHAYCMDITVGGKLFARDICSGSSGSGFFVGQNGYLATNGHVAKMTATDAAIQVSLSYAVSKNDVQYLYALLNYTTLRPSDIAGMSATEAVAAMADAIYDLPSSVIKATNNVDNLMVVLTDTEPDVTSFLEATDDRKTYNGDSEAIVAEMVASDYRAADGYDGYRASDVALLKVEGSDYPIVALAGIDTITQGSDLSIIGFPGKASSNGLVESSAAQATLTSGKVSSIKDVSNSDKKVIETDTTIGHGNSGGPVFNADGGVVGIATYTVDGSGDGNGVYNYVRDIQDLIDLAGESSVVFDTDSLTQELWNKGIEDFYTSRYSRSLVSFAQVQELYPNHTRVDEFIAAAEKRIANGEDVVDLPVVPIVVASVILLVAAGVVVFIIIRHNKKHKVYKAGVAQGTLHPAAADTAPQVVSVTPGQPLVQNPQPPAAPPASPPQDPSNSTWFTPGGTPPNDPPQQP